MEAKHLTFSYGKNTVLKDVSAKFKEKGITTLLGANGSGKSTLFNICTKNLTPERGIIILDGENIFDINQKKFAGKVAIVHQLSGSCITQSTKLLSIRYFRIFRSAPPRYITPGKQTMAAVPLDASHERLCMMKARSAFDFGARTPAGEKRGSLIIRGLASPSQRME